MSWTDARKQALKILMGEGKSGAEIARALGGVSRNAVIGMAHRMGLSNADPVIAGARAVRKQQAAAAHQADIAARPKPPPKPVRPPALRMVKPLPPRRALAFVPGRPVANDTIGCQFIAGDPAVDASKCGVTRVVVPGVGGQDKDSSYCGAHHRLCHEAPHVAAWRHARSVAQAEGRT